MRRLLSIILLTLALPLSAQETENLSPEQMAAAEAAAYAEFLHSLNPQSGLITLPHNIATINLPDNFRYLNPENSERLLVEGWGNPPDNDTLGMIIPTDTNPLTAEGWGVVITYSEDGYVSDDDADEINYNNLLKDMKDSSQEENKQRVDMGYGSMLLVGWAEAPSYDSLAHKMYWAMEYKTDYTEENSLNYNIRILGRKGVLVLNAVAGMNQLDTIKAQTPELLAVTDFTEGNRYDEFNSDTDKVAGYGLAALIAGGAAAKMGLFAKILALLVAAKKLVLVALGGFVMKLFGRKSA